MNNLKHTAVYIPINSDKESFTKQLLKGNVHASLQGLEDLKGAVFSNTTLNYFIEEEVIHGFYKITSATNKSITSMSNGEQKKALLKHLISQRPAYLIIDNIFDNLDIQSQFDIREQLRTVAESIILIQLYNRNSDLLNFITSTFHLEGKELKAGLHPDHHNETHSYIDIPETYNTFNISEDTLVRFTNVCVSYDDRPILKNINWEIKTGEFWQLVGPNGSGKSTILSMITGDNPKAYGQDIILFGRKKGTGESVWDIKRNIGYINPVLTQQFSRDTPIEHMVISGFFNSVGLYVKPSEVQIKIAQEWLHLLGLFADRKKSFRFIPAGQQRLVLIARALVKHPPLLILDEPTSGLDDESAELFTSLVNKVAAEKKSTILYVSHRKEAGLEPEFVYELVPGGDGSIGRIR